MSWEELFRSFAAVRGTESFPTKGLPAVTEGRQLLLAATDDDWATLKGALRHDERKRFVASVFSKVPVPELLFDEFIRAAVYDANSSFNRDFVDPCIASFGHRRVNEALLNYIENGTDLEKAGATNAMYWAGIGLKLEDLWRRKRCMLIREFVSNENVDVRRSIIPQLDLHESNYPDDLQPLVAKAIGIARSHRDDYIRHRVEVQLGNERLLKALPHRDNKT